MGAWCESKCRMHLHPPLLEGGYSPVWGLYSSSANCSSVSTTPDASGPWTIRSSVTPIQSSSLYVFWNPWNYWCLECTRNHQRVLTVMSRIRRDIKPLLQHNSGNNLIFAPWLQSVEAVYVDSSQESNMSFSSKERTTRLRSVWNMGSSSNIPKEWNALKRSKEVSGLLQQTNCIHSPVINGAKWSCRLIRLHTRLNTHSN